MEQLLMWKIFFSNLILNPINFYVLVFSFTLFIILYFIFRKTENIKKKISFLALSIILLFFPFIFSALSWRCLMPVLNCTFKMFTILLLPAGFAAIILSFILLPFIYTMSSKNRVIDKGLINDFVKSQSRNLKIKEPKIYSVNEIKPMAYSITNIKPSIFISAGLSELLTKKEMEAVLLHELYHHKSKAYFWKFSINVLKLFTPLSAFMGISKSMKKEEREADSFAISEQKNDEYLKSAKRKIEKFNINNS